MRICLSLIVAAFVALFSVGASACETQMFEDWRADTIKRNSPQLLENILSEPLRVEFVAAYNASPPVSDKNAAKVAVYYLPPHPMFLVVWIDETGCIDNTEQIPAVVMNKLLRGIPFIPGGKQS